VFALLIRQRTGFKPGYKDPKSTHYLYPRPHLTSLSYSASLHLTADHARPLLSTVTACLYNWAMIRFPSPYQVVHRAEHRNGSCDQNCPVHISGRDLRKTRPETEEEHKSEVRAGEDVIGNAQSTGDFPWSPDRSNHAVSGDGSCVHLVGLAGWEDSAGAASIEEERGGQEVRRE